MRKHLSLLFIYLVKYFLRSNIIIFNTSTANYAYLNSLIIVSMGAEDTFIFIILLF